jgi:hypothetical protein
MPDNDFTKLKPATATDPAGAATGADAAGGAALALGAVAAPKAGLKAPSAAAPAHTIRTILDTGILNRSTIDFPTFMSAPRGRNRVL